MAPTVPTAPRVPRAPRVHDGRLSRRQSWQARPARWRRLPALLCAVTTVLSLTLSACTSVVSRDNRTPTATVPGFCIRGEAPAPQPSFRVPATAPAAADGVVYVGYTIPDPTGNRLPERHDQYAIAALRARDGAVLWRVPATNEPGALRVAAGVVMVANGYGLDGLRASDGAPLWHAAASGPATPSGGVLYVAGGGVLALRLADGHILWQTTHGSALLTPPVVDGTSVYVPGDGSVLALRADTGAVRWTAPTAYPDFVPSPNVWYIPVAAADGQLYLSGGPGIVRLNTADGAGARAVLRLPTDSMANTPVLTAGVFTDVFTPSLVGRGTPQPAFLPAVAAYRLSDGGGQLLWRVPMPMQAGSGLEPATHDAQTFYYFARPQGVTAIRLADGAVLWHQQAFGSMNANLVADSGYLFGTMSGEDDPCHMPFVHQAPLIRALRSADGSVAWTQVLDVTP